MTEPSLGEKLVAVHGALERDDVLHAFGGAIALAYYGEPRTTVDIDCNVFIPADALAHVERALRPLGVEFAQLDPQEVLEDGFARVPWGRTPVDLFFSYDPLHDAMRAGTRRVPFDDVLLPILGPEHLVVCKTIFDRPKDWLDIPQVLVGVEGFDAREVRRWLDSMVGSDDLRRVHFDELAYELLGR